MIPSEPEPSGVEVITPAERLVSLLRRIQANAYLDLAGNYVQSATAIEQWLSEALALAEVLEAAARGDAPDPGGEHGGPAD